MGLRGPRDTLGPLNAPAAVVGLGAARAGRGDRPAACRGLSPSFVEKKKKSKQQNKTSKPTTFYRVLSSEDVKGEYEEVFVCLEGQEGLAALPRCLFSAVVLKIPDRVSLSELSPRVRTG